jgi:hypothetical protein
MFTVEFPYNIGTFVRVKKDNSIGTIACYDCVSDHKDSDGNQFLIVVSGYKEAWSGVYLLDELELLTDLEIDVVVKERG